jgi:transcriptional regulator with XRE-family HTH domain
MNLKATFGLNLKFYRKKKQLSQEQLSEKVDISVTHLSTIERGMHFASPELIEDLSKALEIPAFFLFVDDRAIFYNDNLLARVDRIVEEHLCKTVEEIKADIRSGKE